MLATHPVGYLRFLISIAALGLLAALLLLPAPVRAQARETIVSDTTRGECGRDVPEADLQRGA